MDILATRDAAILLRARVDFVDGPSLADLWLLDAADHLEGGPLFASHRRASQLESAVIRQRVAA